MRSMSVQCDKCGADITLEPSQNVYLGKNKSYDLCLSCYDSIAAKLADVEWAINSKEEKPKTCIECAYYSDSQFWADNSLVATCGSCIKCKRNFVETYPYTQVPSWCPFFD